jgi:hypothetical protein
VPAVLFPRLRWMALAFLLVWTAAYAHTWGWRNFLHLCDVTVFLTVLGLWRGSALLLSSQLVTSFVVNLLWVMDVAAGLFLGRHIIGGTEYMFDARFPLAVRLLSLFHLGLPALHLWAVRRTGYDRRGLALGTALVGLVFLASWLVSDRVENLDFVYVDPLWKTTFGPPLLHLLVTWVGFSVVVFVPTHLACLWLYRARCPGPAPGPS